ncbi:hypothetical protein [Sphingosinicella microcystinivorans]|uniref:hypothetical protein n=1 Tax=Sphingosinicella microcystinivorans TaxID=335406 RepID=UPI001357C1DE|nr:hypothetical protein [Sphingosinicella microcystinivorans]
MKSASLGWRNSKGKVRPPKLVFLFRLPFDRYQQYNDVRRAKDLRHGFDRKQIGRIIFKGIPTMSLRDNYKTTSYNMLESVGLFLTISNRDKKLFTLPSDDGDHYIRFFTPQFKSYHKERVLWGHVGSLDAKILLCSNDNISFHDYIIMSVMIVNFPGLTNPPFIGKSNDDDLHWCRLIKNVAEQFPKCRNHLENILTERKIICGVRIDKRDISDSFFQ